MNTRNRLRKALKTQQKIEGFTPSIGLLLKVLPLAKMQSEWNALTLVIDYRYGPLSYQCHKFYYPSTLLVDLQRLFTEDKNEG